jgi:hypothetical protein
MLETSRLRDQLYLASVIALLLLMSLMSGYAAAAIAAFLFVVGLFLYPAMRRTAIISASVAAAVAILIALVRSLVQG